MPFAASIQSVLLSELNVSCRIGVTYDRAYCGVVGGVERHEYSVLGPAVNLAARLMGDRHNSGFLVASGVHGEATGWSFRALKPIRAKGYADPVPIFEPIMHRRSPWQRAPSYFLGREAQVDSILELSEDLICSGCSTAKMVLIFAPSGVGKSTLMTEAVNRVQARCEESNRSHIVLGQVCCEGDLFRPLCVLGPVLLDILAREGTKKEELLSDAHSPAVEMVLGPAGTALFNNDGATAVKLLHAACQDSGVTSESTIETIYSLVCHHEWPESYDGTDGQMSGIKRRSASERNEIAQLIVSIILTHTVDLDFVLLAVDNVSMMDELSWKVMEIWFTHACNLFFVGTSEPLTFSDFNISPTFSDYLFNEGLAGNQYLHIDLQPLGLSDIERLIDCHQDGNEARTCSGKRSADFAREVYLQSGGNARLAVDIIERFAHDSFSVEEASHGQESFDALKHRGVKTAASIDSAGSGMAAHVLQKLDSVPAIVRTHLNLAALLDDAFTARDVARVMEKFRGVKDWDKDDHAKLVVDSLNEAVIHGILAVATESSVVSVGNLATHSIGGNVDGMMYKFTHNSWREKISQLTLESWRQDIVVLIQETNAVHEQ
jgi:predicted ATPase